ncbi:hypothetical protein BJ741DRAFT_199573 [Chytriomyces cf. hyalinus JEL632]|nr:hypothetical protein BJ741DRAFT_199573 [Chytriomyces cf. hyalinus JEL632]
MAATLYVGGQVTLMAAADNVDALDGSKGSCVTLMLALVAMGATHVACSTANALTCLEQSRVSLVTVSADRPITPRAMKYRDATRKADFFVAPFQDSITSANLRASTHILEHSDDAAAFFWSSFLDGAKPTLVGRATSEMRFCDAKIDLSANLDRLSALYGISAESTVKTAWALTLGLHLNLGDVLFQVSAPNGVQPCRVRLEGPFTGLELLKQVHANSLASSFHSVFPATTNEPVNTCVRFVNPDQTACYSYLCTRDGHQGGSCYSYQHAEEFAAQAQADMVLAVCVDGNELSVNVSYNKACISSESVDCMLNHFANMTARLTVEACSVVQNEFFCSSDEIQLLQAGIGADALDGDNLNEIQFLHQTLEHTALTHPDAIAAQFESSESITYFDLNNRANRVALALQELGVGPEVCVPICMDRSILMLVTIVGILKAGGAYVPLAVDFPKERCKTIIEKVSASFILASDAPRLRLLELEQECQIQVLSIESMAQCNAGEIYSNPMVLGQNTKNLAYVLFTSGSTGEPKGVMIEHEAAVSAILAHQSVYKTRPGARVLQYASYTFDVSVLDIFLTWSVGACICMASQESLMSNLSKVMADMEIEYADLTVTIANLVRPEDVPSLKSLVIGAETVTREVLEKWAGKVRLLNTYGPTETTIACTGSEIFNANDSPTNIGMPFGETKLYILDADRQLVPTGGVGELCIGGPQLGRGYLKDDEKTSAAFIPHPFIPGQRLYLTGDLVKRVPGGAIEILGRKDSQIKLHGLRIELGEIVSAITRCPGVESCAIVLHETEVSGKELVAFVVLGGFSFNSFELVPSASFEHVSQLLVQVKEALAVSLPAYMIPSKWIPVSGLPTNSNGKLDNLKLRASIGGFNAADIRSINAGSYNEVEDSSASFSEMELLLRQLWSRVLGIECASISRRNAFRRLGGDSLDSIRLLSLLREEGIECTFSLVHSATSLADQAIKISSLMAQSSAEDAKMDILPFSLSPSGNESGLRSCLDEASLQSVPTSNVEDVYPATPMQIGFVAVTLGTKTQYICQFSFNVKGDLDRFKSAWVKVVKRTPILRTTFAYRKSKFLQVVLKDAFEWRELDADTDMAEYIERDLQSGMHLGQPFVRFSSKRVSETESTFYMAIHHALFDAWSYQLMWDSVKAFSNVETPAVAEVPFKYYVKYALENPVNASYWTSYLDGALPTKFPRAEPTASLKFGKIATVFDANLSSFTRQTGASTATLLKFCWGLVLANHAESSDVLFGCINSGRDIELPGADAIVGPLIVTHPVRVKIAKEDTLAHSLELLELESNTHRVQPYVPLNELRQYSSSLKGTVDSSKLPFDTLLNFYRETASRPQNGAFSVEETSEDLEINFPIQLDATTVDGKVEVVFTFDESRISSVEMEWVSSHLQACIHFVIENPTASVGDVFMISPEEVDWHRMGVASKEHYMETLENTYLHELVEEQAAKTPNNVAIDSLDENLRVTYAQLNSEANKLSQWLHLRGIGPGSFVPICFRKCADMIIVMLAILKTGAAYVPLHWSNPLARNVYIIESVSATVVFSQTGKVEELRGGLSECEVFCYRELASTLEESNRVDALTNGLTTSHLGLVIFTSGTTGVPKGVMIDHAALANAIKSYGGFLQYGETARVLQFSNIAFDISVSDIFVPLISGSVVILADDDHLLSNLEEVFNLGRVTHSELTPSVGKLLNPENLPLLKMLNMGGEALSQKVIDRWFDAGHCDIVNSYGPSEVTVCCFARHMSPTNKKAAHIGLPFGATKCHILDENLRLVPKGCVGDMCFSGPQVAAGYFNNEAQTSKSFVISPDLPGIRLYRSGDMVRMLPNEEFEILGRRDGQIKLNGQRMEIQEITEAINLHPQVLMNAVMVVKENEDARPALAGFFVPKGIQAGSHDFGMATREMVGNDVVSLISEIKDFLAISLPVYMIPTKWIPVTRLPTTANGKTDNKALIKLLSECGDEMTRQMNDNASQSREPPSTEAEIALCAVWKDLLGDQDIWKSSSFYMLGGDSIAAIMLLMRCREMGFTLSISDILRCPVLEKMAERITSNNKLAQEEQEFSLLPFRLRDIPTLTQVFRSFDIDFDAVEDAYPALVIQNMLLSATFAKKDRHFDQVRLDISGIIDEADLRAAVLSAIGNSAVFRTTFIEHEGLDGYIQVVLKNPAVVWSKINLEREEDLDIFLSFDRRKSPKLGGPFFHFNLLKISPLKHVLIWSVHPCLVDDQSISNFFQDVSNVLSSAELVVRPPLNALVAHEFAASKSDLNNKFWKKYLKDAVPTPFPAAADAGLALTSETIQMGRILKTSGFTDTTGVFLSTVIKAAWCLTLSSEIESKDVIIGMMTSGREVSIQDIQNLNGPAAKSLPLRVAVPETEKSILDFLLSIQDSVAEVLANGSVSGNQSETKESPLFQTVVNYQSMQKPAPLYAGFHHVDAPKMTRAALTLDVKQEQNGLNFSSSFDGTIITEDEVNRLLEKAFDVTDFIFNNVTRPLRTLDPILRKGEALQINELVSTKYYMDQIDNGFLHQLVEQQTARSPANLAIDSLDESIQLTYAQLNGEANRLAWFLRKSGVKAGVKVPICYEKCKDMVVSILAVLKAGGSYVALNYSNPMARNLYIIDATEAIVVLMSDAKRIEFAEHISDSVKLLTVSQIQAELALESVENLDTGSLERQDLAYTIFTSGSTGVPKGVLIDHHAVVNSIVGYSKFLTYESTSRVLQFSNLAFDVSVADIFNALSSGAALVVASQDRLLTDLQNVLIQGNVTHAFLTPTVAKMLNPWSLPNLQELTMGGEVLSQKVVDNWLEAGHCRLGNGYGPSEVTIFCSVRKITKEERTANNIGLPFGSTRAYILDDQLRFVPNGTVGELCFSGPQLSAGYFNNPEQTAKSFTYSDDIPGVRIYRSGDFARLLPNGETEILGRMDGQIKLNGLRIEILEIVESIEAQHGVSSCAVLLAKDKDASRQRLLAFFVPAAIDLTTSEFGLVSESEVNHMSSLVNEVKANVGRILPQYMIPSHWVPVTSIPTNANGKTDSKLLLELVCESNARFLEQVNAEVEENDTASPPATEAEIALSKVWMNVLQVSSVSKSSSFFALGGDSLLAIKLLMHCREIGFNLTLSNIIQAPKLESMALRLVPIETSVSVYEPLSLLPESLREQNALQRAFEQWNIDPDNVEDVYPSADLQTGMLADTFSRYTQHFDQITLDLWGLKDTKQFKKAIFSAVANNTSLKTTFIMDESYVGFLQVVLKEARIVWNEYTLSNDNEVQIYQELEKKKSVELGGSLMQFTLLTLGPERHVLIWSSHHSLLDGMSIQNIYKDIVDSYLDRKLVNRPPYRLYVEYEMQAKTSDSTKFFWSQYLKNASFTPFPHNLPQSAKPSAYKYKTLSKKFLSLGITEKTGVLLSTLFKAAWAFVLSVHSAKKDILFGMISAGREAAIANITDMVGLCIRSLPLRIIVPTDATILEYLVMVQDTISNIISHNTSLQEQQKLNKQFDQVRMFHTLANFRGFSEEMIEDAELPFMMIDREDFDEVSAAIAMEADVKPDGLQLSAFFDHHHVSESETELLLERMHHVMEFMANNMDKPIQELSAMPASEVATLSAGVMGSPYENESRHLGLHELFEKQVQRVPENVAVQFENQDFVTYDELNTRANRLARYLREHGAGPEAMIPFCLDRSIHMITSILAILKSGAGVVPLDPLNPTDRNKFVIEDVAATMVITEKRYASLYESETVQMILIDDDDGWVQLSGADVDNIAVSSNICYVLYTSGSTGKPKGVVLEHGAVSDAIIANLLVQHVTEASRVLQFSSCTFDVCVNDIFLALATGATLCMANKQTLINDLAGTIRMMQTSFAFFTPSTAKLLTPAEVPSMKEIVLGGEPVSKSLIQTWLHHVRLSIVCGPTEAMIAVVAREVADDIVTGANLGKPFGSTKAFVLDEDLNILPVGVIGELCISSDQLAREYFHLPEKTNSTFVDNPFMPGQKMMRTGDLVKFTPELDVVIFGRKDTQIKLNGQRIEISEIEENIAAEPNVAQVLVDLVEINKTKVLTAFILPSFETEKSQDGITANQNDEIRVLVESVRSRLNKNLAPYMIPRIMVPLHKLPLTSHGKADKKLLQSVLTNASSIEEYLGVTIKTKTAPEGSREKLLQGIWSGLFNIPSDKIYREDSFFALGGDSILAILLVKGCQKGGFKLAVHQIFEHPRLEDLASRLTTNELIVGRTYKNWSLLDPTVLASLPAIFDSLNMSVETVDDAYPATAMQQGLVAASQQDSSLYVAQFGYLLEGIVDAELFRQSWANVVGKTPILRTTFALSEVDGSIIQMVMSPDQFNWCDDSESTSSDQNAELDRLNGFQFGEVFSKFRMIRINSGQFKFIWTVHHALYDGWCHKQIFNDVLAAYNGDIAPERLPFSHYVEYTLNQSVQQTEEFWKMYLKDFTKTSYPKRILGGELKVKSVSDSVAFDFDLSEMLSRYGIGVSAVLKAAWGVVLSRHSNVQDVVFGLVNSGRDIALSHGADVVGPLLATVPVRFIGDSDAETLSTLVKLQQDHVNQVEHTYFGLRRITATVQDENQNTPLFSTLMNILNFADEDFTDSSFKISELDGELDVDFPLVARFYPSKSGVNIDLSYNTGYVTDSDAKLLVRHVQTAIQQIVLNPSMPLSTVHMMDEEERNLILKSSSASPASESSSKCLHELFEESAAEWPDEPAVKFEHDPAISYAELNKLSNQLARIIRKHGVKPDDLIPLILDDKSAMMVVSIFAILKAGAAYIPIDATQPEKRKAAILQQIMPKLIITNKSSVFSVGKEQNATILMIDDENLLDSMRVEESSNLASSVCTSNLAYLIFTSGSTGTPKGVMVEHGNAACAAAALQTVEQVPRMAKVLQFVNFAFDISVSDIMITLFNGAELVLYRKEHLMNSLASVISSGEISFMRTTTSVLKTINPMDVPMLKTLIVGGEPMTAEVIQTWARKLRLVARYGATEVATACIEMEIADIHHRPSLVGRPLPASGAVILDDGFQPVALGCIGELCITGPQLTRGYFQDQTKTEKAFMNLNGQTIYRTGDSALMNPDGTIDVFGRKDGQVKINGLRIEIGEIETHLLKVQGVAQACVQVFKVKDRSVLTAFVVPNLETAHHLGSQKFFDDLNELLVTAQNHLAIGLPSYFVPSRWIPINLIPLTKNGKVDKEKLQELFALSERSTVAENSKQVQFSSETESLLATVWSEVLRLDVNSISPQDSFLKIGGDSIGAILLSANLRKRGYKISVAQIFQTPVLTEMALKLEAESLQVQKYIPFSCPGFSEETMKRTLEPDLIELGTSWSTVEDIYPTSPMQDGLLAITLQIRDQYVAQYIYSLAQDFSLERLQHAWREVIQKTPVLRTTFLYSPEIAEGIQVVVKQPELIWTHIECPVNQEQSTLETYLSDDLELGMTFGKQFVRFATISSSEKSTFVWTIHHALYDGWCLNQILSDVWRAYANEPIVTRVPYAEYIKLIRSLNQEESLAFWGQYLDQCKPTRFPQDAVVPFSNASTSVDKSLDVNLKEFTKKTGITAATLFNVSWAFILAKHENVDDVVFGFTNSGRDVSLAGITDVIGPCINIIPVRVIFDSEQDVWELLSATQTTSQTLATHGHVGLRSITKPLNLGGTPLFQTLINFRQTRFEGIDEELGFIDLLNGQMELQFPLVLDISSGESGATFSIEFRPEVDERLVSWLADQLSTVVTALTANIATPVLVKDISMIGETMGPILADELSDEHLEVILQENPGSLHASGSIQLLHQFLEHQAAINPSNIAVDCEDEEAITYEELNNRANKLARILSNYGVGPESIVPICLEKSSLMIIGIFGVLKAGAAYVPLDPTNPISRLKLIIHNVEAVVVLTSQKLQSICISCDVETLCIDTVSKVRNGEKIVNPTVSGLSSSNLAYIIFTSGSTGEPKGVMIEHFNAVESVWAQARVYNPRSNTRFLQYSNYTFDASIGDIFIPQTVGACICLASKDALMTDVARVIRDMNIDFVYFTATVAAMVDPLECPNLKLIAVGAEPVTRQVLEKWADRVRLLNIYGPTETTVTCIVQEVPSVDFSPKIIGKPFGQNVVHILEGATPVAPGCVGELCISGPQVARGYFKNPSKTAEVFVEVTSGSKMYRTGDLVRLHPGNMIEILGRKDSQIKLHGFRIEVDEIVSAILMDVDVLNSVVLMMESDAPVQPYLCAFFVPSFEVLDTDEFVADAQLLITRVKSNIANILPTYMIPSKWLPISSIPRNASGKTDSRSLIKTLSSLAPELLMRYNTEPSSAFGDTDGIPMTANECFVRSTLSSLLKVNESTISKTSSFFNIGGDSVTAILFTAQCRKVGFEIQVAEIMREPRISSIANNLRSHSAAPQPEREPFALLKSAGLSKDFVFTEFQSQFGVESSSIEDAYPASALQEGMLLLSALNSSFYKLQYVYNLSGVDIEAFKSAWDRMVSRYEIFRTTFALIDNQMVSVVYKHTSIDWINISAENGLANGALNNFLHTDLETPVKFGRSINTFALIELPENTFKFIWLTHHALTDAWYMDSLKSDFLKAYTGQELMYRPPYSHYMKYVLDIDEGESERFWMQYLDNAYPTAFPEDRSIQLSGGTSDAVKAGRMEFPIAVAFKQFLQQHGITPSTVFRAAWAITLALHAGTNDVLFGFINSGREIPVSGISEMIGLCINTVPVRVKVDGSESVENFLRVLQEQNHALVQNSHLGLRKIRRLVADRFEKEMFKTFINFRGFSFDAEAQEYPFSMEQEETPPHLHNYAIGVNADLEGDIVHITADYNKDDVTDEMMVVIMQHFSMIMKSLVANVSGKVSDLVAMPEPEQAMLEQGVTASLTETSNEENHIRFLHELVEHAAVMFPNNVAAQFESDESITYFELNNRANKLATSLQQLGVGPETCVPICVDRSIMMLIAILGVLKAGGAYVPLDAANPVARNMRIMETVEAKAILASESLADLFESLGITVLVLEEECLDDGIIYDNPVSMGLTPNSLAYVLFTSGSTGEPKGVMIEHEAAVESIRAQVSVYGVCEEYDLIASLG